MWTENLAVGGRADAIPMQSPGVPNFNALGPSTGKALEAEALIGVAVRTARPHGINAPITDTSTG